MRHLTRAVLAALLLIGPVSAADLAPDDVIRDMKRVAEWQIANPSKHRITDWTHGPYFLGLANLHHVSGEDRWLEVLEDFGMQAKWGPGPRPAHADDHAVLQGWLEVYRHTKARAHLLPTLALFDKMYWKLEGKPAASPAGGTFTWCWCDALFMSPPVWAHLSEITGESIYMAWADCEWWTTTDVLYDPTAGLYYRDNKYFGRRTESGRKVFWSRGNGWVVGGLVHMLDRLPADHPSREKYLGLYGDMMRALLALQAPDGLWRSSLMDPEMPTGESSGSSFFVYAMAWGLNRGLLDAKTFGPAVKKGWDALSKNVQPDGRLGFVQQIGEKPGKAGAQSTEVYGTGAFLLAGAEIVRMLDPKRRRKDLASFEGVTLPARYLREKPRVHVRFVPERKDDFAWENDLIAFRAYGPALRFHTEDSGFDAWPKRVPWPIIDKWYLEDRMRLPYGNVAKSYHADQGEGADFYKVGQSRGCGGINLIVDGDMHRSNTFIDHRIIEATPERAIFELDYASRAGDKVVRETKRITVVMGQRFFQCESRFTVDGKAGKFNGVICLAPQSKDGATPPSGVGTRLLWEQVGDLGLGTGIVVDPAHLAPPIDGLDLDQVPFFVRTDETGYVQWFAGYAWEGQGEITTVEEWMAYVAAFAKKFGKKPFADHSSTLRVHTAEPPPEPLEIAPVDGVSGAFRLKTNGGWCWYQDPRAIVLKDGRVVFNSVAGAAYAGVDGGDLHVTAWNPETNDLEHFELADKFEKNDHAAGALLELPDGRIHAVYGRHIGDRGPRWRTTVKPGAIGSWTDETTFDVGARYSYTNLYHLSAEDGRLYNFSRTRGFNPNCSISDDGGKTWRYGWRLLSWTKKDLEGDPKYTGIDGCRPYVRYAGNGKDEIHFITTEDHPRAYDNSIWHGYYKGGKLHDSTGKVVGEPGLEGTSDVKPKSFTEAFRGAADRVAWGCDLELDKDGRPYATFSVQVDGAEERGKRGKQTAGQDHRYWYARFDGKKWHAHEMAYAGTRLYPMEDDYTGLVALDPDDPDVAVISTNADPATGKPLVSVTDGLRHWELYRGRTADGGKTWKWSAITRDSKVDNLRPLIPANPGGKRVILWCRGDFTNYGNYRLDVCGMAEER